MTSYEPNQITNEVAEEVIARYNFYFQKKLGSVPGVYRTSNEDHHCFVPSAHFGMIGETLFKIRKELCKEKSGPFKFLDAGCGVGNIMLIAQVIGFTPHGVEYEKETYKIAKELVGKTFITQGDIATFEHYEDYDLIYYYEPIRNRSKKQKFFERLANDAKIGAIIYSYGGETYFCKDARFKKLAETVGVYKKVHKFPL